MELNLEFNKAWMARNILDIDDIADFAIEASNDLGEFFYLVVKTKLGTTLLADCGPIVPDVKLIPGGYKCTLTKMEYKEDKLKKFLNMWINDRGRQITTAKIIEEAEAIAQFRDLGEYLTNLTDENF